MSCVSQPSLLTEASIPPGIRQAGEKVACCRLPDSRVHDIETARTRDHARSRARTFVCLSLARHPNYLRAWTSQRKRDSFPPACRIPGKTGLCQQGPRNHASDTHILSCINIWFIFLITALMTYLYNSVQMVTHSHFWNITHQIIQPIIQPC